MSVIVYGANSLTRYWLSGLRLSMLWGTIVVAIGSGLRCISSDPTYARWYLYICINYVCNKNEIISATHFKQISKRKKILKKCILLSRILVHPKFRRNEERKTESCMSSIGVNYSNTSHVHWMNESVGKCHMNPFLQERCTRIMCSCQS